MLLRTIPVFILGATLFAAAAQAQSFGLPPDPFASPRGVMPHTLQLNDTVPDGPDDESFAARKPTEPESADPEADTAKSEDDPDTAAGAGPWSAQRHMWGSDAAFSNHWRGSLVGRETFRRPGASGEAEGDTSRYQSWNPSTSRYGSGSSYRRY